MLPSPCFAGLLATFAQTTCAMFPLLSLLLRGKFRRPLLEILTDLSCSTCTLHGTHELSFHFHGNYTCIFHFTYFRIFLSSCARKATKRSYLARNRKYSVWSPVKLHINIFRLVSRAMSSEIPASAELSAYKFLHHVLISSIQFTFIFWLTEPITDPRQPRIAVPPVFL